MLALETAVARVLESLPPITTERVPLAESAGRVLAENLFSQVALPAFDNSAMDGYALRTADVRGASHNSPSVLKLVAKIPAGEMFSGEIRDGECARLFTGSPMPHGADSVVMQEDTRLCGEHVEVLDGVVVGENIRKSGEDVGLGETLAASGAIMTPGTIGLLAATGIGSVMVGRRPVVSLLATGSELREPGEPLTAGQIYESNRAMLSTLVESCGGVSKVFPIGPDSLDATRTALRKAFDSSDIVVTSGGVSVGELDFVKAAFESLGGSVQFWKVAMRPGKPFVFGRLGEKFLFGLPGNPVSAFVTFLLLVRPAMMRWQGAEQVALPVVHGVLGEAVSNPSERRHFMRVRVGVDGKVFSAGKQASHALASLASADGLLDLPPQAAVAAGSSVLVLRV